jgi:hypothetical protein
MRRTSPKSAKVRKIKVWVAVNVDGYPSPWTVRRTRRDAKRAMIHEWLGPDLYERMEAKRRPRIERAILILPAKAKGKA